MRKVTNKLEAIEFIFNLYEEYKERATIPWSEICFEAKAYLIQFSILKSELVEHLKNNPKYLQLWDDYLQDKRTDQSHFFQLRKKANYRGQNKDEYVFGYNNSNKEFEVILDRSDEPYRLCIDFIYIECEFELYSESSLEKKWWKYWEKFSKNNKVDIVKRNYWAWKPGKLDI